MPDECQCLWCPDCGGSGQMEVETPGYPEWDLESCLTCGGTGVSEECAHCALLDEIAESKESI